MKNLKKVLALVVALTMVLGTVAFAFTDVTTDDSVYTAVQTLSSLGILNGYEDGTFGAEKDITRAEFCAVVCRALNLEGSANGAKGATQFTDVPADHWATGYINLAAGQGIVNGMGDGTFEPESNVTYEQAVKMLVVALGFEPMAAQKGGYPTGYLVVANQYGMTKGVSVSGDSSVANRGVVAQLTFNALDIPMMIQTGFGTNTEYGVQNGKNGNGYKTLLTDLSIIKRDGVVVGTPVINGTGLNADQIKYDITTVYGENLTGFTVQNGKVLTVAEGVVVDGYFGIASTIYLKEVKTSKWEVISIMPGEASETIEIAKGDISGTVTATELKYFESETATNPEILVVDFNDANDIIYNNKAVALNAISGWGADTEITIIENTGDSVYDMIVAKEYVYDIVDEVEADRDRFTTLNGSYRFDFEKEGIVNKIVDKDGNAITLADFAEGDVIAVLEDSTKNYTNYTWIEVINLGQNVVTGKVTELGTNNEVYVDGVEYEKMGAPYNPSIAVNDEGTYYLTKTGKIFNKKTDASIASNYAYVLEAKWNNTVLFGAANWQVKLLAKDGSVAIYDMADTFTFNGTKFNATGTGATQYTSSVPSAFATISAQTGTQFKSNPANQIVTYKLNANNEVIEIAVVAGGNISAAGQYRADVQSLNGKALDDNATIFNLNNADIEKATVATVASLVDEVNYTGIVIKNADGDYDCVVITAGAAAIDAAQAIAVVAGVGTTDYNDETVTKVRYYTENDATVKELIITSETNELFDLAGASDGNVDYKLTEGALFMFADDGNGVATFYTVIANSVAHNGTSVPYAVNANAIAELTGATNGDIDNGFVCGYITGFRTGNKGRIVEYYDGVAKNEIVVPGKANAYTYINDVNRKSITVADWQDGNVDKELDATFNSAGVATHEARTYFFARTYAGTVTDMVTYSGRVVGTVVAE